MANYLGRNPAVGTQKMLDSLEPQFDGALATFDLRYNGTPTYPTLSESLIVSLGGVLQEPGEAYYVSSDKIVFSEAPQAGTECWILLYSQYGASTSSTPSLAIQATGEPNGIETKSHSVISFDNGTRVFTIAPNTAAGHTQYVVWTKAVRRVYSVSQSVTLPPTTGLYYIYFSNTGVLSYRTDYFDWENDAMVAYVYWNAATSSAPFVADERHGITLDWATHEYLHRTRGAVIANGFGINAYSTEGDGSADTDAQFDLANGTFFDEDLEVAITHSASPTVGTFTQILQGAAEIPVFYHSGNTGAWVRDAATTFAAKQSATTLQYNSLSGGTWSTTPAGNNRYVVSWVVATNEINAPVICVLGQDQYSNIGAAEATSFSSLDLTNFPVVEFRPLWKIIFHTSSGYANTPNAYIAGVTDLRQLTGPSGGGELVSDHGGLTGLADDDHSQYVHISAPRTISATHDFMAGADFTGGMVSLSGGAILANSQTISGGGTTTIPAGYNANSFGPVVTIANGTEVVVSSTSFWVIRD